jgi:hypothetical protein
VPQVLRVNLGWLTPYYPSYISIILPHVSLNLIFYHFFIQFHALKVLFFSSYRILCFFSIYYHCLFFYHLIKIKLTYTKPSRGYFVCISFPFLFVISFKWLAALGL